MNRFYKREFVCKVIIFVVIAFLGYAAPTKSTTQTTPPEPSKPSAIVKSVPTKSATDPAKPAQPVKPKEEKLAAEKATKSAAPATEKKPPVPETTVKPAPESVKPVAEKEKVSPFINVKDPRSILYLDSKGKLAGTGDPSKSGPASEAAKLGAGWHPEAIAAAVLPKDRYGLVDWTKAAREKVIAPQHSLDPNETEMPPLDINVLIESKGDYTSDVIFPHWAHTWWLKCQVCHPAIFVPQKGANNMTMVDIVNGKFCGRCHGKVAFPLTDCNRCHTSPKKPTEAK